MDVLAFKHPSTPHARVGSLELTLRPLSPFRLEQAKRLAADHMGDSVDAPGGGALLTVERMVQELSVASGVTPGELRGLAVKEVCWLHRLWSSAQDASFPASVSKLQAWIRRRVNDDPQIMSDGVRAYMCESPTTYYNAPLADLTDGQVAYWQILRAAYAEWHVPDHNGRRPTPTRQWLNSDD